MRGLHGVRAGGGWVWWGWGAVRWYVGEGKRARSGYASIRRSSGAWGGIRFGFTGSDGVWEFMLAFL